MVNYLFIAGIILLSLGLLMKMRKIDFLIDRFQSFHKFIRKEDIKVDRERLAKFHSYLYIVIAMILLIGALILLINSENADNVIFWTIIISLIVGISGIVYCNISKSIIISN